MFNNYIRRFLRKFFSANFLVKKHTAAVRWPLGILFFILTYFATFRWILAKECLNCIRSDEFTLAFRRLSWYLRRSWLRIDLSQDPIFNCAENLSQSEVIAQQQFIIRREASLPRSEYLTDLAFIAATQLELSFDTSDHISASEEFDEAAAALLDFILNQQYSYPQLQCSSTANESKPSFSLSNAEQALRECVALLEKSSFRPFVLSGTFLGAVREGSILKHDYDIDIGLMNDEIDIEHLSNVLGKSRELTLVKKYDQTYYYRLADGSLGRQSYPVLYKLIHVTGVSIDVFIHYREDGHIWHGSSRYRWLNTSFDLIPWPLAGINVLGPSNPDRYLSENYGNWRVPRTDFHCGIDTNNQSLTPNPVTTVYALRELLIEKVCRPYNIDAVIQIMHASNYIIPDANNSEKWIFNKRQFV